MSKPTWGAATLASASLFACSSFYACTAAAQSAADTLPEITVTAIRDEQAIQKTGSAVTVISREEIETAGPRSFKDVLQGVPGVTINETSGPGSTSTVYLRGSDSRHTLVLIDGVRANDPSSTGGEVDFALLAPINIERIEVLRGPQSALYGSDAIGGVINIITRKGEGPARTVVRAEAGSYGTLATSAGVSGSTKDVSYSFVLNQFRTNGFSRYAAGRENDATARQAASGRVSYRANEWLTLEAGGTALRTQIEYDAAYGLKPDSASNSRGFVGSAFQRAIIEYGDGKLTLTASQSQTRRNYTAVSRDLYSANWDDLNEPVYVADYLSRLRYVGARFGTEAQNDLRLGAFGQLTTGVRYETEKATSKIEDILPAAKVTPGGGSQSTGSAYALYSVSLFNRLHLSAGGRVDNVSTSGAFWTYRLTGAYVIDETGTKVRSSFGTGAKSPSLYQLADPLYGNPNLRPETSRGWDIGVDQYLWDRRLKVFVTYFDTRMQNLITADAPLYHYYNVAAASATGVEFGAEIQPADVLKVRVSYTHLTTKDLSAGRPLLSGLPLLRRPANEARASLAWTPTTALVIEPVIRIVGARDDVYYNETAYQSERVRLASFVRYDLRAEYKVNDSVSVFARGENLTDKRYVEAFGFRQTGRAAYAGFTSAF